MRGFLGFTRNDAFLGAAGAFSSYVAAVRREAAVIRGVLGGVRLGIDPSAEAHSRSGDHARVGLP